MLKRYIPIYAYITHLTKPMQCILYNPTQEYVGKEGFLNGVARMSWQNKKHFSNAYKNGMHDIFKFRIAMPNKLVATQWNNLQLDKIWRMLYVPWLFFLQKKLV